MFKLKPGNVFQKINKMDKKQAYTWGAIIIVCFIALITLASFMGDADETSFDSFNTRGYDLAQMPFVNDEAEEYLLASKYPDMQGNNASMLYSSSEKKARQEEDAQQEEGATVEVVEESSSEEGVSSGYGGYSGGYGGGGASAAPTQVGQLGNASVSHASGSGVNTSWGAPRGDFSPYKSQEKGAEEPIQFKNQDARRALSQFAQTSRAAAGFRDAKGANAKRALMGGNVQGSEAFAEGAVDLSKSGGLALDTNAPVSSADLSNLGQDLADAADDAQDDKDDAEDDFEETMGDRLLEQLYSGLIDLGMQGLGSLLDQGLNSLQANIAGNRAYKDTISDAGKNLANSPLKDNSESLAILSKKGYDQSAIDDWLTDNPNGTAVDFIRDQKGWNANRSSRSFVQSYTPTSTVLEEAAKNRDFTKATHWNLGAQNIMKRKENDKDKKKDDDKDEK